MGRYRKVDPRVWNDEKFRDLSDHGKLVFFFLLTHPHMTALGAMRASIAGLAAELGWQPKAFREAFGEAFAKGMVKHDEKASFVWLPNFLRYNGPESPNVIKSWAASLDLLPECSLKSELLCTVKTFAEALSEAFNKALPKAFAKGMPNQEPDQKPEYKSSADTPDSLSTLKTNPKKRSSRRRPRVGIPPELQATVSRIVAKINELSGAHYHDDKHGPLRNLLARLND